MSMCDRCVGSLSCCLNVNGKACKERRKRVCPDVVYSNEDRIRDMDAEEIKDSILAVSLGYAPWCDHHCKNQGDDGCDKCIEDWLQKPALEG